MEDLRKDIMILTRTAELVAAAVVGEGADWAEVQNEAHERAAAEYTANHCRTDTAGVVE